MLLALGVGGGFGVSLALAENPPGAGAPSPVAATSPSLPIDPVPDLLPDPPAASLDVRLALTRQRVGSGDFMLSLPAPRGWDFFENSLNEWQWRPPDHETFTYSMRVEQVLSQRRSVESTLTGRIDDLDADEDGVAIVSRTADSLHYTYVTNRHLRHGFLTWLDLTGSGLAQVEIAVSGREVDVAGMADLIARVAAGVRLG